MTQKRKLLYKVLSGLFQHHWIGSIHIRAPSLSYTHADIKSCIAPVTPAHIPSFFLPYQICQTQSEISEVRRGESWAPSTTQKSSCLWQRSTESRKKLSTCDGVGKYKDKLKVGKACVPNTMEVWCYGKVTDIEPPQRGGKVVWGCLIATYSTALLNTLCQGHSGDGKLNA